MSTSRITHRPLRLSRRTLLRAGGVSIALPLLEAMLPTSRGKAARAAELPRKRFVAFFSPNGVPMKTWAPTGTESQFALSPILAPLEPLKSKIIVLKGVDQKCGGAGDGHQNGMVGMLTAQVTNPGPFKGGCGQGGGWANGISVDQYIANEVGKSTKFKSLELGVVTTTTMAAENFNRMSYAGPDMPLPPEENPENTFKRLFGDLGASPMDLERVRRQRKTVLDAVSGQYRWLKGRLGAQDGQRIEAHLTAIREIESRLDIPTPGGATSPGAPGGGAGACAKPTITAFPPAFKQYDQMPAIGKLQMDMLAVAFACDLTRVATLEWSKSSGSTIFSWLGINRGHHDISHAGDSDTVAQDQLTKINNWYAQQFFYLINKLNGHQEPGGTILDNSLVLWCNELGKGNAHTTTDAPYVIAGSGGNYFKTGRFLDYPGNVPHSNLLVSLINGMGIPATTFGKADWCTGPLERLK